MIPSNAYRHFRSRGYCPAVAADMARAETWAQERGIEATWEYEDYTEAYMVLSDYHDENYGTCPEAERERKTGQGSHEHEVMCCRMSIGENIADLYGIIDPDNAYRRDIEAELASELFSQCSGAEWSAISA